MTTPDPTDAALKATAARARHQGGFDFTLEHCKEPMVLFGMRTEKVEAYYVCARKGCEAVASLRTGVPEV